MDDKIQETLKHLKNVLERSNSFEEFHNSIGEIDEDILSNDIIGEEMLKEPKYYNFYIEYIEKNAIILKKLKQIEIEIGKNLKTRQRQIEEIQPYIHDIQRLHDFILDYAEERTKDMYDDYLEFSRRIESNEIIEDIVTSTHALERVIDDKKWVFAYILKNYNARILKKLLLDVHRTIKNAFPKTNERELCNSLKKNISMLKKLNRCIDYKPPNKELNPGEELKVIPPLLAYEGLCGSLSSVTNHLLLDNNALKRRKVQDEFIQDDNEKRVMYSLQEKKRNKYVAITQIPSQLPNVKSSKYLDPLDMAILFTIGNLCDQADVQERLFDDRPCYSFTYKQITQALLSVYTENKNVSQKNIDTVKERIDKMRYCGLIFNLANDHIQLLDKDGEIITATEHEEYCLMAVRDVGKTIKGQKKEYITFVCPPLLHRYVKAKNQLFYLSADYFKLENSKAPFEVRVVLTRSLIEKIERIKNRMKNKQPTNCKISLETLLEDTHLKDRYPLNNASKKQNFITLCCNILDHLVEVSKQKKELGEEPLIKWYKEYKQSGVSKGFKIEFYEKEEGEREHDERRNKTKI